MGLCEKQSDPVGDLQALNPFFWFARKLASDQNVHRASSVIFLHEVVDFFLYQIVAFLHTPLYALAFWGVSVVTGVFLGHWAIEYHDRHGDEHRPMAQMLGESWLWEGKENEENYF